MVVKLQLFQHQKEFVKSTVRHTALIAGYGSGKSFAGVAKTVLKKLMYPGIPVAYYLPTYGLIKDIAFPKFSELLGEMGIPFKLNRTEKDIYTPYGIIHLRSMDKPETIVGYEVGYSLIDETDILTAHKMQDVFTKIIARNRRKLPNGDINQTDVVGTPEGFKWAYKFFVKEAKDKPERRVIKGTTHQNTTLPENYIESLRDVYTEEQLAAYIDGEFVNLTSGTVYRAFSRADHHTDRSILPGEVLHIGMDFNITNMHAVVHVFDGKDYAAVEEIVKAFDTPDMIRIIQERFPGHQIVVYPDAAGASRKTSGPSDHNLLKAAGFKIKAKDTNPFVRDRVNAVNGAFRLGRYLVNTNNCPTFTEALENQDYLNGEPNKTTGYDHINEAAGYFVNWHDTVKTIKASYSY